MEKFKERFDTLLIDKLNITINDITQEAKFREDLGADSLDMAELTVEFEKEFGVSITDDEAEQIMTVGDAVEFLREKLKMNTDYLWQ